MKNTTNTSLHEVAFRSIVNGKLKLPSQKKMKEYVDSLNAFNLNRKLSYSYYLSGVQVMDNIAQEMGVYPKGWNIFWRDPLLAWRVWYGPLFSAHYRLLGPDSNWEEARRISHLAYESRGKMDTHRSSGPLLRKDITAARKRKVVKVFFRLVLPVVASAAVYALGKTVSTPGLSGFSQS